MARILLVDDEPNVLCILSNLLQSDGHSVAGTLRGDKAKQRLHSKERIDLMLTDLSMWPITGMELIKAAREIRPSMPIIILSAYVTPEVEEEARTLGVTNIISKPWVVEGLLAKVREVLQWSSANVS
jgi:CheY-like chemotaxis protein